MRPGTLERIGTERLISFQILGFYGCYSTVEQLFAAKLRKNCANALTTDSPSVATLCKTVQKYVNSLGHSVVRCFIQLSYGAPVKRGNLRRNGGAVK